MKCVYGMTTTKQKQTNYAEKITTVSPIYANPCLTKQNL